MYGLLTHRTVDFVQFFTTVTEFMNRPSISTEQCDAPSERNGDLEHAVTSHKVIVSNTADEDDQMSDAHGGAVMQYLSIMIVMSHFEHQWRNKIPQREKETPSSRLKDRITIPCLNKS